jgi:DNA-directed RNA polymerase specialized sigma24 family protein
MQTSSKSSVSLTRAEVSARLGDLSGADWARARRLARAKSFGLTGADPDDVLQQALVKLLSGERIWPPVVAPLVVLGNAIRSIAGNWRKRAKTGPIDEFIEVAHTDASMDEESLPQAIAAEPATPERMVSGEQQLERVQQAVAHDEEAGLLLSAWAEGLRGDAAMTELNWSVKTHDAARKRLSRCLVNRGRIGHTQGILTRLRISSTFFWNHICRN